MHVNSYEYCKRITLPKLTNVYALVCWITCTISGAYNDIQYRQPGQLKRNHSAAH